MWLVDIYNFCCCSVARLYLTPCNPPMDCSMPGFPGLPYLLELAQIHVHWVMMLSNHLIFCRPLLLLPSIFSSIRVFSNELTLCITWPKYWNFNICDTHMYLEIYEIELFCSRGWMDADLASGKGCVLGLVHTWALTGGWCSSYTWGTSFQTLHTKLGVLCPGDPQILGLQLSGTFKLLLL